MKVKAESFHIYEYILFSVLTAATLCLCVCMGSVAIPVTDTIRAIWNSIWKLPIPDGVSAPIIMSVRLPRVIAVALTGASLSLCGASMQGLLRNPLADGSTLGVSSGASLGAVFAILFNINFPALPFAGTMIMATLFAFGSLALILSVSYAADRLLSTHTIILMGIVFSMFASSLLNLLIAFSGEKLKSITFWTMGSLAGSGYENDLVLLSALVLCGGVLLFHARELNAFSLGENAAKHIGVNVKRVKLTVMIAVSVLIGVCVSVGGSIGFVGLTIPHIARILVGANHKRLLPASMFLGAIFLMLADLLARTILNPIELPIGVVTSLVGAVVFVLVFFRSRKKRGSAC
ncbi:MAG: iron ABC transporter permease [Clostridiales bacterium]|nr:iron ABC transporter permease [Clostridiales bacterium]